VTARLRTSRLMLSLGIEISLSAPYINFFVPSKSLIGSGRTFKMALDHWGHALEGGIGTLVSNWVLNFVAMAHRQFSPPHDLSHSIHAAYPQFKSTESSSIETK
jgi:hypothetical protein